METKSQANYLDGIAIIGMSGRFPGASTPEELWQNVCRGVESIARFSEEELLESGEDPALLHSPNYVKASAVLRDVEWFDAEFFGFSPREAALTDPQHRIFLECAWEALEKAGYDPDQYQGRIGVFAGAGVHCFYSQNVASRPEVTKYLGELQRFIALEKDFINTRVSYRLNLKGPSITVQSACSTSLVAVHLGCQSLLNGECDMVLAGGVSIRLPQAAGYLYQEESIVSPDGHCRAFDEQAQGTVFGSGAGIVVLKRVADAIAEGDAIHAVITGSCINNDGAVKVGYTAPSVEGQARCIAEAQAMAGVSADEITYVEAHGTGTKLGDPIEIAALTKAFRHTTTDTGFCAVGSLKTNIGHLDTAAGVAGLIKTALAIEHRTLPPSLHFTRPNPAIDFEGSPFFVQRALSEWKPAKGRCIAGVSSFGIGGTNAHVIVEEAPLTRESRLARPWQLLTLSANSSTALDKATDQLAVFLSNGRDLNLADVAFTLQQGRKAFPYRRAIAAKDVADAIQLLKGDAPRRIRTGKPLDADPGVVFLFPAQGAQHANMAREIYETERIFREQMDFCAARLEPLLGLDIRQVLYPLGNDADASSELLKQTRLTQPAVFAVNYSLARLWMSWGVTPVAMVGHSLGEYVAATLAGVFELQDALDLVAERARLMQELPVGSMLAVHLPEHELQPRLPANVSLAAVNGPSLTTASGSTDAIARLERGLQAEGIECQRLHTSHAFHSPMMDPMLDPFIERVTKASRKAPQIPFVSTLTGTWISAQEATDPGYWGRQTRNGVRFSPAILELLKTPGRILLEVGPGNSLTTLARQHVTVQNQCAVLNSLPHPKEERSDKECLLNALGAVWVAGMKINWNHLHAERPHRVPLPTYPFERKRFWIDAIPAAHLTPSSVPVDMDSGSVRQLDEISIPGGADKSHDLDRANGAAPRTEVEDILATVWREILGIEEIGLDDNFFELGGHSLMAVALVSEMGRALGARLSMASLIAAPTIREFSALYEKQQHPASHRTADGDEIVQRVRNFVLENYLCGHANGFRNCDSLRENGLNNEMSILDLISFLEESFGIIVPYDEFTSSSIDSVDNVARYIHQRLPQATGSITP